MSISVILSVCFCYLLVVLFCRSQLMSPILLSAVCIFSLQNLEAQDLLKSVYAISHLFTFALPICPGMQSKARLAFLITLKSDLLPSLLPWTFPETRVDRQTRALVDSAYLRNVTWGKACGVCDRPGGRIDFPCFVFVEDNDNGKPIIYLCYLCKIGYYPNWHR